MIIVYGPRMSEISKWPLSERGFPTPALKPSPRRRCICWKLEVKGRIEGFGTAKVTNNL